LAAAFSPAGAGIRAHGHRLSSNKWRHSRPCGSLQPTARTCRGRNRHYDAGRCEQLINNVVDRFGGSTDRQQCGDFSLGPLGESSFADLARHFTSNLYTVLYMCRARLAAHAQGAAGRIINMGPLAAESAICPATFRPTPRPKPPSWRYRRSLALRSQNGITVNVG